MKKFSRLIFFLQKKFYKTPQIKRILLSIHGNFPLKRNKPGIASQMKSVITDDKENKWAKKKNKMREEDKSEITFLIFA